MADEKKKDPYAITRENDDFITPSKKPDGEKKDDGKDYTATAGANALMDVFTLGNQEAVGKKLRGVADYLGISGPHKIDKSAKDIAAENPYSTMAGTALGYMLPVAGAEALIGNAARGGTGVVSRALSGAVPKVLGGESALATGARAALAEGGVSAGLEAGKAATGNEADWMNPIYNAAFGGVLGGFGQKAADIIKGPTHQAAKAIRERVGPVPDTFQPGNVRGDPTPTLRPGEVAQTAPEALQAAGLGKQAGDAEAMLQQVLGGKPAVVPGRDAQLAAGTVTRDAATKAADDAMQRVGTKQVQSPFQNAPDLQNIHFQSAGKRPQGDASLFGFGSSIEEAMKQTAGNPGMQRQIDDALANLQGQGHPQVGNLLDAERMAKQFEDFKQGFGNVTPTPQGGGPGAAGWAASKAIGGLGNLVKGHTGLAAPLANPLIDMATGAIQKVLGNMPAGMPKNPQMIEQILMNPTQFSSILKPEEIAALTKLAAARGGAATFVTEAASGGPDQRLKEIQRRYPSAY